MTDNTLGSDPELPPEPIVAWQPIRRGERALTVAGVLIGAMALGALAIGAVAIGTLAVGRLTIGRVRLREVVIDDLTVRRARGI